MAKRVLVLTLISLLVLCLNVFGAYPQPKSCCPGWPSWSCYCRPWPDQGLYKIIPSANEDIVGQYLLTPDPKVFYPVSDDTVGYTYYDYQHNNSQRRQIANGYEGILHFTWMNLVGHSMADNRYVDYNSYDPSWPGWIAVGGIHITPTAARGGYSGLDILPDSREVLAYHRSQPTSPNTRWGSTISIEKTDPGIGEFYSYDIPDSVAGKSEKLIWPYVACSKSETGDTAFIHITNFSDSNYYAGYIRCFQDPNLIIRDTLWCQSPGWSSPIKIPNGQRLTPNKLPYLFPDGGKVPYPAAPVATSPVSNKVAIAWYDNTAGEHYQGEIFYAESNDNGSDWMEWGWIPINQITNYGANNWRDYLPFLTEIAAVYDYNDVLHIFWTTSSEGYVEHISLWHWSPVTGIREVTSRYVTANCGAWNNGIAKMTAGVGCEPADTAYNYLYVLYTGFSNDDTSAGGFANGDLYLNVSSNGGLTWSLDSNLTNTNSNGCTPGNCQSEHWSSIAERVDSLLYVQYIYDLDAGGIPQDEGTFTNNPVRYLKLSRMLVPAVPKMCYTPVQMISPMKWATNGGTTQDTLEFDNRGTATLYVQMSGPPYVTITPSSFNIVEAGPTQIVNLSFNGAGLQDTIIVDSLMIASNDSLLGGGEIYADTEWVKFHFVVTDTFYYAEYDTVSRGVRLTVSNVGNLGNQEENNMMYFNGHDYLFDFTPVFVTLNTEYGPISFSWLHDRKNYLAQGHLEKYDYPKLKTTVFCESSAPIIPVEHPVHWHCFWPNWIKYSRVVNFEYDNIHAVLVKEWWKWIERPQWWPSIGTGSPVPGYIGIAADWDVPSEASQKNIGGYDDTLHMVWLTSDSTGFENFYGAFLFMGATKMDEDDTNYITEPLGCHILTNATQLYPFEGYNDDSLFKYMRTSGYSIESSSSQDMNIVMSFMETQTTVSSDELYIADYVLLVSDGGLSQLYDQAKKIKIVKAGDANVDGTVSVSDIVYEINYLFKGGPEPWLAFADVNGDCVESVSDVVYKINYLFKGGPAPVLCWDKKPPW